MLVSACKFRCQEFFFPILLGHDINLILTDCLKLRSSGRSGSDRLRHRDLLSWGKERNTKVRSVSRFCRSSDAGKVVVSERGDCSI